MVIIAYLMGVVEFLADDIEVEVTYISWLIGTLR